MVKRTSWEAFVWILFGAGAVLRAMGQVDCTVHTNRAACLLSTDCEWCFFSCRAAGGCPATCDASPTESECVGLTTALGLRALNASYGSFRALNAAKGLALDAFELCSSDHSKGGAATEAAVAAGATLRTLEVSFNVRMWDCGTGDCADGHSVFIVDADDWDWSLAGSDGNDFGFVGLDAGWAAVVFDRYASAISTPSGTSLVYVMKRSYSSRNYASDPKDANYEMAADAWRHTRLLFEYSGSGSSMLVSANVTDIASGTVYTLYDREDCSFSSDLPATIRVVVAGTTGGLFSNITVRDLTVTVNGEQLVGPPCTWCSSESRCSFKPDCNMSCEWADDAEFCAADSTCHWCLLECLSNSTSCGTLCNENCALCDKDGCVQCEDGYIGTSYCYKPAEIFCPTFDQVQCVADTENCSWCDELNYCSPVHLGCRTCKDYAHDACGASSQCKWCASEQQCLGIYSECKHCSTKTTIATCEAVPGCLWCADATVPSCMSLESHSTSCSDPCTYAARTDCIAVDQCAWCSNAGICLRKTDPCANFADLNATTCLNYWCSTLDLCVNDASLCPLCSSATSLAQCTIGELQGCSWCEAEKTCGDSDTPSCQCSSYTARKDCLGLVGCEWCETTEACQSTTEPCYPCWKLPSCNGTCAFCDVVDDCIVSHMRCPECSVFDLDQQALLPGCRNKTHHFSSTSSFAALSSSPAGWIGLEWWVFVAGAGGAALLVALVITAACLVAAASRRRPKGYDGSGVELVQTDLDGMKLVDISELGLLVDAKEIRFDNFTIGVPVGERVSSHLAITPKGKSVVDVAIVTPVSNVDKWKVEAHPSSIKKLRVTASVDVAILFNCTTTLDSSLAICNKSSRIYAMIPIVANAALSTKLDYDEITFGEEIGRGGFGTVLRGVWRKTEVAIKEVPKAMLESEDFRAEFDREVSLLSSLRSPYIVTFYGTVLTRDHCAIVMEYVALGSLEKTLQTSKLSDTVKIGIALDCAQGMQLLHANGILHRDLKAENLLVVSLSRRAPVRVKLTDFGSSRAVADVEAAAKYTKGVGTPAYMAPEILSGKVYDMHADVYSYGILLWTVLTQKIPFEEIDNNFALITHISEGKRMELPHSPLAPLVERCWAHEPSMRPTFEQIVEELRRAR